MGTASSYSGLLTVNTAPYVTLTAPSTSSGEDFATTVLNMPWTMTSDGQVQAWYNISNHTFGPGYMQAQSNNGDPQMWFLNNDSAHAINTAKYHYLNYQLYIAKPAGGPVNGQDYMWNAGPRAIWTTGPGGPWQTTLAVLAWYNRWLHVGMDLSTAPLVPGSNVGWHGTQSVFRLDPHEGDNSGAVRRFPGSARYASPPTQRSRMAVLLQYPGCPARARGVSPSITAPPRAALPHRSVLRP